MFSGLFSKPKPKNFWEEYHKILEINPDMPLKEAVGIHVRGWGFKTTQGFVHEFGHFLVGLSGVPEYQGRMDAEIYALPMETLINRMGFTHGPVPDFSVFLGEAHQRYENLHPGTNLDRALYWLLGEKTGQTMEEMIHRDKYDFSGQSIRERAEKKYGIKCRTAPEDGRQEGRWEIEIKGKIVYRFNVSDPLQNVLPSGSNGVEEFQEFVFPPPARLEEVYRRVHPMLEHIREAMSPGRDYDERIRLLENMKLSELTAGLDMQALPPLATAGPAQNTSVFQNPVMAAGRG